MRRPSINIVPLVDILLVLLIAVMSIAVFQDSKSSATSPPSTTILIKVTDERAYIIDNNIFSSINDLIEHLDDHYESESTVIKFEWAETLMVGDAFDTMTAFKQKGYHKMTSQRARPV